jgi:hypothetical protein
MTYNPNPPANVDIAPAGSAAVPNRPPYGQAGEPSVSGVGTTGATSQPATTPTNPTQPAIPGLGTPGGPGGNFQVDQITAQSRQQVADANAAVDRIWSQIKPLQQRYAEIQASGNVATMQTEGQQITSQLNSLYTQLGQSMQTVETSNAAYAQTLVKAMQTTTVDPAQANLYNQQATQAQAAADLAKTQADVLQQGSQGQRDLIAAQIGKTNDDGKLAAAQATLAQAQAGTLTPAQAAAAQAQANAAQAQANSTNALLPGLIQKQAAETGLTEKQTQLVGAQSDLAQAQATESGARSDLANAQAENMRARTPGEVGLLGAQATAQQATAASELAKIQQGQLGPMYGLQDQLNAIRNIQQQVFGPGGSGNAEDANKMLQDYMSATVSGTTPYAASVAAANAGLTQFGTQAGMYNAMQQALASRANAYGQTAGSVLGTLAQMNANAPAGSTAMAGAFNEVMRGIAAQQQSADQQAAQRFGMTQQPTAPALPPLLQRFAAPGGPQPAATAPNAGAGSVNINISGGGPAPSTTGAAVPSTPAVLQGYQPATTAGLAGLWGNELQSGVVRMPQQMAGSNLMGPQAGPLYG